MLGVLSSLFAIGAQAQAGIPNKTPKPPPGWKYVAESDNGARYFVHKSSAVRNGSKIEAWELINNPELQEDRSGKPYKSEKHFTQFDCSKRTTAIKSLFYYDEDMGSGNRVFAYNVASSDQEAHPVMPDTVGESVFNAVCQKPGVKKAPSGNTAREEIIIAERVEKAKNASPYLIHWEANDPQAWDEALRQDEILRDNPKWAEKSYDARFKEVVRRVRAIMPEATAPSSEFPGYVEFHGELDKPTQK